MAAMGLFRRRRPDVKRLQRKGDSAGLRRAVQYRDPVRLTDGQVEDLGVPVRRHAMSALREDGGDEAIAAAVEALADNDAEVRQEAIGTLSDGDRPEPLI